MTTIASACRLLADTDVDNWAMHACEFLEGLTLSELKADAALRAQVRQLITAAYADPSFAHCYLSVANDVEQMLEEAEGKPSLLDKALAALGAKPYHPVYHPVAPLARPPTPPPAEPVKLLPELVGGASKQTVVSIRPLPGPMDDMTRRRILRGSNAPAKPDMHGCGYFDGAPWDICYACEYEKDPSNYERKMRHSDLVQLISAYFRDAQKGSLIKGWSNETLEDVVAFLDTPREHRSYTDEQISRGTGPNTSLFAALRELNC